jgi:hypothetical protein
LSLFWSRLLPDALAIKVGLYRLEKRELVHGQTILVLLHSHRGIDYTIFLGTQILGKVIIRFVQAIFYVLALSVTS